MQIPTDAAEGEHTVAVFGNQPGVFAIMPWALGSSLTITAPPATTTTPATTVPSTTAAPTTTATSTTTSVVSSASSSTDSAAAATATSHDSDGGGSTPWGAIAAVSDPDTPPVEIEHR